MFASARAQAFSATHADSRAEPVSSLQLGGCKWQ
jgi:hypothetical protein